MKKNYIRLLVLACAVLVSAGHCLAAETVVVESRKADGTPNSSVWTEVDGKWKPSKNKTRVADATSLVATNVSICATNVPLPAFKVSPDLKAGTRYKVEATFSTSKTQMASSDLVVAVSTEGVAASTIPTNTPAFQGAGANEWNTLGTITPSADRPSLTFTYVSGTLSPVSRWYADAIRFTPQAAAKTAE